MQKYLIRHRYQVGDQDVTVEGPVGLDMRRAAVFVQFRAEEWFGDSALVSNLGIAAALVTFYGCQHAARGENSEVIDMHLDREVMCGTGLLNEPDFQRDGLLPSFLKAHLLSI